MPKKSKPGDDWAEYMRKIPDNTLLACILEFNPKGPLRYAREAAIAEWDKRHPDDLIQR